VDNKQELNNNQPIFIKLSPQIREPVKQEFKAEFDGIARVLSCGCYFVFIYIGVPGGMCQTSGECSLC